MKKSYITICFSLIFMFSYAQFETTFYSPTPQAADYFGSSVAVYDDFMIVGAERAYNELTNDNDAGVAYIYKKDGTNWLLQQKIEEPEIMIYSQFGATVDISENYAIIGAPQYSSSGAAFIYKKNGNVWERQLKLPEKYRTDFGYSVAINENYAIVGAIDSRGNGPSSSDRGSAWVYKRMVINSVETWQEIDKLTASDEFDRAHFGHRVKINDNVAVVSAYTSAANENYNKSGVYIFERNNENWNEVTKIQPDDASVDDREQFGYDIDLYNNNLIVGTPEDNLDDDSSGSAYIFEKVGNDWILKEKLVPNGSIINGFGRTVAINDTFAAAYAETKTQDGRFFQGTAFIYRKYGDDWVNVKKLSSEDMEIKDYNSNTYGRAMDFSQDYLTIGHSAYTRTLTLQGVAFVYDVSYLTLEQPTDLTVSETSNEILLQWVDNSHNETGFVIERSVNPDFSSLEVFTTDANIKEYYDEKPLVNTTYYYRIKASNDIIYSQYSNSAEISSVVLSVISETDGVTERISMYPNPTSETISIKAFENASIKSFELFDVLGKKLLKQENKNLSNKITYNLRGFSKGIYLIKVELQNGQNESLKLILN